MAQTRLLDNSSRPILHRFNKINSFYANLPLVPLVIAYRWRRRDSLRRRRITADFWRNQPK